MKICIVGGRVEDYPRLDKKLNELIEMSGQYLFTLICGKGSLGELWGRKNGSGIEYYAGDEPEAAMNYLIKHADYAFVFYNGENNYLRRFIMKMKESGKHGYVFK